MLKRVNENEFKLNLQLFAGDDDNKDEPIVETLTKEEVEAKLKEVEDKYTNMLSQYDTKFKELETKLNTPKIEDKKEEIKLENKEEIPAWAKALIEKNEQLEKSILQNNDTKLSERKNSLKETFGLEDSDLEDIKDEKSLNILEKNLKKLSEKKDKEVETKIPTLLKEQGFEISQFNKITQETKKVEEKNKNIFNTFFGNKK